MAYGEKTTYTEIAKCKISRNRNAVISVCSKGGFTLAQQLETQDNGELVHIFLKGAIHVDTMENLKHLRNTLNYVLKNIEEDKQEEDDWESIEEDDWDE